MSILRVVRHSQEIQAYQYERVANSLLHLKMLNMSHIELGLGRIRQVCRIMDNPQNAYRSILVGGTNGKGSVCAFLSSILQEARLKVGLYTSPHLINPEERIQINGESINKYDLAKSITELKKIDRENKIGLTYFEFLTAIAFRHFKDNNIDIGVFEVGLGGRYDATNILNPLVSCITHVDYDHINILGKTLSQIAREKAGIIKESSYFINAESRHYVKKIFKDECAKKQSVYIDAMRGCKFDVKFIYPYYKLFLTTPKYVYRPMVIPLIGYHQVINAILAVRIAEQLNVIGMYISPVEIMRGIRRVHWEGRLEIISQKPTIIIDCAHNPDGINAVIKAMKLMKKGRLCVIYGVLKDKPWKVMTRLIDEIADYIIFTKPDSDRALSPDKFLKVNLKTRFEIESNPELALAKGVEKASSDGIILVLGSTYLVGEIKNFIKRKGI